MKDYSHDETHTSRAVGLSIKKILKKASNTCTSLEDPTVSSKRIEALETQLKKRELAYLVDFLHMKMSEYVNV